MHDLAMAKQDLGKSVRLPLSGGRKEEWESYLERTGLSQQEALYRLMDWFLGQPPIAQAVVMGSVPATPEVVRMALENSRQFDKLEGGGGRPHRRN